MKQAPGACRPEGWPWLLALMRMRTLARGPGIGLAVGLAMIVAGTCQVTPARADDAPAERCVSSPLATAAAVFPGVLVHGTGHYMGGDRRTARRLLIIEGMALGGMVVSGAALGLSGASRRLSVPAVPMLVGTSSVFLLSWAADIYGAAGGPRIAGTPRLTLPALESRLGYLYVFDPQFAYGHFMDMAAHLRHGPWRAGAQGQIAMDDDNQRVRGIIEYRLTGPQSRGQARDGTALDVLGAMTWHRYGSDGFASGTGELAATGRYDLARLSPSTAGAFAELGLGLGLEITDYQASEGFDMQGRLLAHFAFGVALGTPGAVHGEVRLGYDHRRDGLVGGLAGSSGFLGNFGGDCFVMFGPRWGVAATARVGSAYLAGASLLYSQP